MYTNNELLWKNNWIDFYCLDIKCRSLCYNYYYAYNLDKDLSNFSRNHIFCLKYNYK